VGAPAARIIIRVSPPHSPLPLLLAACPSSPPSGGPAGAPGGGAIRHGRDTAGGRGRGTGPPAPPRRPARAGAPIAVVPRGGSRRRPRAGAPGGPRGRRGRRGGGGVGAAGPGARTRDMERAARARAWAIFALKVCVGCCLLLLLPFLLPTSSTAPCLEALKGAPAGNGLGGAARGGCRSRRAIRGVQGSGGSRPPAQRPPETAAPPRPGWPAACPKPKSRRQKAEEKKKKDLAPPEHPQTLCSRPSNRLPPRWRRHLAGVGAPVPETLKPEGRPRPPWAPPRPSPAAAGGRAGRERPFLPSFLPTRLSSSSPWRRWR